MSNSGYPRTEIDAAATRAYQLRDRLPPHERALAIAYYFDAGPGTDRIRAAGAYQELIASHVFDGVAYHNYANLLTFLRQPQKAESLLKVLLPTPEGGPAIIQNLMGALIRQGKFVEARVIYDSAMARPATPALRLRWATTLALGEYLAGNTARTEQLFDSLAKHPEDFSSASVLGSRAALSLLHGRVGESYKRSAEHDAFLRSRGIPSFPFSRVLSTIDVDVFVLDQRERARARIDSALAASALSNLPVAERPYIEFASANAIVGRPARARALLAERAAVLADSALLRAEANYIHFVMGEIAMAENRPRDAIREYWQYDTLADGSPNPCEACTYAFVGYALDQAGKLDSAIVLYEKFLTTRFPDRLSGTDDVHRPRITRRLGELYEAKGDRKKAIERYQAFVELWKNADPELQPRVEEIRKRLIRLRAPN